MPRLARLDAPGILHHVMGRGIERKKIFINVMYYPFLAKIVIAAEISAIGPKRVGIGTTAGTGWRWIG